jgi:hypothetical protein
MAPLIQSNLIRSIKSIRFCVAPEYRYAMLISSARRCAALEAISEEVRIRCVLIRGNTNKHFICLDRKPNGSHGANQGVNISKD